MKLLKLLKVPVSSALRDHIVILLCEDQPLPVVEESLAVVTQQVEGVA